MPTASTLTTAAATTGGFENHLKAVKMVVSAAATAVEAASGARSQRGVPALRGLGEKVGAEGLLLMPFFQPLVWWGADNAALAASGC